MSGIDTARIHSVRIHPAIGIARVGNSPTEYFIGPEVAGRPVSDAQGFRDGQGRLKRQAARFRVYGLDAQGRVLGELTAATTRIEWTVHLANTKAAWFAFELPLDIPGAAARPARLRNAGIDGDAREQLVIDPGARRIGGASINAAGCERSLAFQNGRFFGRPVYLGELRTDDAGRLLVLGGHGASGARGDEPILSTANNDGWHDDISDGPVEAVVHIGDRRWQAEGAWVVVAPPDYAPGVTAMVTGHDLAFDAAVRLEPGLMPPRPSFHRHVLPIFERLSRLQWVNAGFMQQFGWSSPCDFTDPRWVERLNDPSPLRRAFRRSLALRFRDPAQAVRRADAWPPVYGDQMSLDANLVTHRQWLSLLPTQHAWLMQWAEGAFDADGAEAPIGWEDMDDAVRARSLDVAALENTCGGPFHPGLELPWVLRQPLLYERPWRIRRASTTARDWGREMTQDQALSATGPLAGSGAGSVTRWLGCPWQADFANCRSACHAGVAEYLPAFWPSVAPNDVLAWDDYALVMDRTRPFDERLRALEPQRRPTWNRGLCNTDSPWLPAALDPSRRPSRRFIDGWHRAGIVQAMPGPGDDGFPERIHVETGRSVSGETDP